MDFNYIDIHSHLNIKPLLDTQDEVIARMRERGVATITVGTDYVYSKLAIEIAQKFPDVVLGATVGLHPNDNVDEAFASEKYLELAEMKEVVAIGECGLDYYRLEVTGDREQMKNKQKEVFRSHIEIALKVGKPLMLHCRPSKRSVDAYLDALEILTSYYNPSPTTHHLSGNFHFYVGDLETTKKILALGFTMSFDGPITFSHDYDEVIKHIPLESLHAETDAPFASPAPYRGKTCEPWMVEEVVKRIAEIKELPLKTVQEALKANVKRDFHI